MKRFLNSEEKRMVLTLICLTVAVEDMIKGWDSLKKTPEVLKYLKMGRSFIEKGTEGILSKLDEKAKVETIRSASTAKLGVYYTALPKAQIESQYTLDNDEEMAALAELVIEGSCKKCNGRVKGGCLVKSIFEAWEVPPNVDLRVDESICQYSYIKEE
jgi:hypothetical protein